MRCTPPEAAPPLPPRVGGGLRERPEPWERRGGAPRRRGGAGCASSCARAEGDSTQMPMFSSIGSSERSIMCDEKSGSPCTCTRRRCGEGGGCGWWGVAKWGSGRRRSGWQWLRRRQWCGGAAAGTRLVVALGRREHPVHPRQPAPREGGVSVSVAGGRGERGWLCCPCGVQGPSPAAGGCAGAPLFGAGGRYGEISGAQRTASWRSDPCAR